MIYRKTSLSLLFFLLGLFSLPTLILAQPLRIVTENMPPYNYQTNKGKLSGPSTEVVRALLKSLKLKTQIEVLPWARAYKLATTEPDVMIFSIIRSPAREPLFHWLEGIGPIDIQVFAMPDAGISSLNNLNTLEDLTLGILRDSSQIDFIKDRYSIPEHNIIAGKSYEQLYRMNQRGRVNLFAAPALLSTYLNHKLNTKVSQQPISVYTIPSTKQRKLHLAFSKATSLDTVAQFRKALATMQQNGEVKQIFANFQAHWATRHTE